MILAFQWISSNFLSFYFYFIFFYNVSGNIRHISCTRMTRYLLSRDLNLKALKVISIKFLLVIAILCKTEWSWDLRTWSHKMYLRDILSTSPLYFYSKRIGAIKENFNFDLKVLRVKQQRFWVMHVNRKWTFWTLRPWFWSNSQANRLYKSKDT